MPDYRISIRIESDSVGLVDEDRLRKLAERTLVMAGVTGPVEMGLVIACDETVRELNRSYREVDATTDVLAFGFLEPGSLEDEHFVTPPDSRLNLGEVIISYPQAARQAGEHNNPLDRELALLVAHGTLHLLGYDHADPEAGQRMQAMEARVLDSLYRD
jgi:probable rRNA maturation factor